MALINKNDYGAVAINDKAIEKMVVEDLLAWPESLIPCNKKGRPIYKSRGNKRIHPDCYDAVEIYKKDNEFKVKVYCISKIGKNVNDVATKLIDSIESDFELFKIHKPGKITINFKGLMDDELEKINIEVSKSNE